MRRSIFIESIVIVALVGSLHAQTPTSQPQPVSSSPAKPGADAGTVYFDGDGIASGSMSLTSPTHLLEAISKHGCCKDFANRKKIHIIREGKMLEHEVDGKMTPYYNYRDIISGNDPGANPLVQDGDHIVVP